jgi:hypothetical protein
VTLFEKIIVRQKNLEIFAACPPPTPEKKNLVKITLTEQIVTKFSQNVSC